MASVGIPRYFGTFYYGPETVDKQKMWERDERRHGSNGLSHEPTEALLYMITFNLVIVIEETSRFTEVYRNKSTAISRSYQQNVK